MVLALDDQCSLDGLERDFPEYYTKIKTQFQALCYGQEDCDLFVRNRDWPTACAEKIGIRLELKTIPRTKYKEVVNRIESYEEKAAEEGDIGEGSLSDIANIRVEEETFEEEVEVENQVVTNIEANIPVEDLTEDDLYNLVDPSLFDILAPRLFPESYGEVDIDDDSEEENTEDNQT